MAGVIKAACAAVVLIGLGFATSCKKEVIQVFKLNTITVNGVDMMASSPVNVPVTAIITAIFSTDVDPATVSATSVILTQDYDSLVVPLSLIISRNKLTIGTVTSMTPGAHFTLNINSTLKSLQGIAFQPFMGKFKTAGTFVPSGMVSYWSFEGTANDVLGTYSPLANNVTLTASSYVPSKNATSGTAAYFDGTTDIVEILNGTALLGPEFTITLWMQLQSANHVDASGNPKGSYVFGIGNRHGIQFDVDPNYEFCRVSHGLLLSDGTTMTSDFQYYGNGRLWNNLAGQPDSILNGIDNATTVNQNIGAAGIRDSLDNRWAQIAFTYDDSTKTRSLYINGSLMYRQTFSLLDTTQVLAALRPLVKATSLTFVPDTSIPPNWDDHLVFAFWQSKLSVYGGYPDQYGNPYANHFKGLLDDIRIFNRSLSSLEVSFIYEDERP